MTYTIAIQPDRNPLPDGRYEWSDHWAEAVRAAGHTVRPVDLRGGDPLGQLQGCDALLWRFVHVLGDYALAQRILPVVERHLQLVTFPDWNTCWHYDDKIVQSYLFEALGIPSPKTWIFWRLSDALDFCRQAPYPLVAKLSRGASASNVMLLKTRDEAERFAGRMFNRGVRRMDAPEIAPWPERLKNAARWLVRGRGPVPSGSWELQKNYAFFQEFLPGNAFDTRISAYGRRAYGFRRFNRDNDFRASGSGRLDRDPEQIDPRFIRLAMRIARDLKLKACAIDGLYRNGEPCVGEISYTHGTRNIFMCPGHWLLDGDVETGELRWQPGSTWPQDFVLADLFERLRQRSSGADTSTQEASGVAGLRQPCGMINAD